MRQSFIHIGAILSVIILCITLTISQVKGATANVTMSVSGSQLRIGDTISVTVSINTEGPIGSYSMAVSYDPSVLEYTGGAGNGGGGTVMIAGYGDGSTSRLSAALNFRAVGNGSTSIATSGGEVYTWDEASQTISHAGVRINVSAPTAAPTTQAPNTQAPNSTTSTKSPASVATTEAPSTREGEEDNYLRQLEITPGNLEPAFSPERMQYTVHLPEDTKEIRVSALPRSSKAKVRVLHANDLEPGKNTTSIVVTAENGVERTYILTIYCGEETAEEVSITIQGKIYRGVREEEQNLVELPEGFSWGTVSFGEEQFLGGVLQEGDMKLLPLFEVEQEELTWFVLLGEQLYPYVHLSNSPMEYYILTLEEELRIPQGYQKAERVIGEVPVQVYLRNQEDEIVLVYATTLTGKPGLYWYDTKENTYLRYEAIATEELQGTTEEITTEVLPVPEASDIENALKDKVKRLQNLLILLCGVAVLGMCGVIFLFIKKK